MTRFTQRLLAKHVPLIKFLGPRKNIPQHSDSLTHPLYSHYTPNQTTSAPAPAPPAKNAAALKAGVNAMRIEYEDITKLPLQYQQLKGLSEDEMESIVVSYERICIAANISLSLVGWRSVTKCGSIRNKSSFASMKTLSALHFASLIVEFSLLTAIWSTFGSIIRGQYAETYAKYFTASNNASLLPTCEILVTIWFTLVFLLLSSCSYELYQSVAAMFSKSRPVSKGGKQNQNAAGKPDHFKVLVVLLCIWTRVGIVGMICWFSAILANDVETVGKEVVYNLKLSDDELFSIEAISNAFYYTFSLGLASIVLLWGQQNGAFYALGKAT